MPWFISSVIANTNALANRTSRATYLRDHGRVDPDLDVAGCCLEMETDGSVVGSMVLAFVAFIPSCTAIMSALDARRFGVFQYATYGDVQDFRIYRYLPDPARSITLEKTAMGHRAKYSITEAEMRGFIDRLWQEYGKGSAVPRENLGEGEAIKPDEMERLFGDLGWPPLEQAIRFHSPVESDGGGAEYFLDTASGTAYHRAGYW